MNYIYDICLNFNKICYDFFEWNKNDKITHIKKIPIYKVNVHNFKEMVKYDIQIEEKFIKSVHNKTESYIDAKKTENCALFCDDSNVIALCFNNNGKSIYRSNLLVYEELETLEIVDKLKETNLNYNILKKIKNSFKTRKQLQEEKFIIKELKNINLDKLKYIYYECFNKKCQNKRQIINDIKNISYDNTKYNEIYNILKITSTKSK